MAGVPILTARPDPGFELTVVDLDPQRVVICAVGELDLAAKEGLVEVLQQQEDAGRRVIHLDVSEVTFLDGSCAGVLLEAHHRFPELHGLLVLTGVDARIARILKVTGLEDSLFTVPTGTDPFENALMTSPARGRVRTHRPPAAAPSFDTLMAVAVEPEPRRERTSQPHSEQVAVAATTGCLVHAPSTHREVAS